MSKTSKKKFQIEGMHCSSCAMDIDFDLEDVPGVIEAKTSYAKQESEITFDEEILSIKEIVKSIEKTGYKASLRMHTK